MSGVVEPGGRVVGRRGETILAQRARPRVLLMLLLFHAPVLTVVFGPPAIWAAAEGEGALAWALAAPTAGFALLSLATLRLPRPDDTRGVEALATVGLVFTLASLAGAPAFVALGLTPAEALFESVSGVTSTGLSVAAEAELWPASAHFLRAWLQWCGGFAVVAAAVALVVGPGAVAQRLGGVDMGQDDLLVSTRTRARSLLVVYVGLTLLCLAGTAALARDPLEGVFIGLAAVSTGGFTPAADSLASESRALQAVVILTCLIAAISFPLLLMVRQRGPRVLLRDPALRLLGLLLALGALLTLGAEAARYGVDDLRLDPILDALFAAASGLSTAGFSTGPVSALAPATLAIVLPMMIVGADVGSTGGGLKAARAAVAFAAVRMTFFRAQASPRAVTQLRALDRKFESAELAGLAALATLYAVTAGVFWTLCLAHGEPALASLFDVISALSTVGLSAGVAGPDADESLKALFAAAMILGRVEFFAILILFRPATWIPRR